MLLTFFLVVTTCDIFHLPRIPLDTLHSSQNIEEPNEFGFFFGLPSQRPPSDKQSWVQKERWQTVCAGFQLVSLEPRQNRHSTAWSFFFFFRLVKGNQKAIGISKAMSSLIHSQGQKIIKPFLLHQKNHRKVNFQITEGTTNAKPLENHP